LNLQHHNGREISIITESDMYINRTLLKCLILKTPVIYRLTGVQEILPLDIVTKEQREYMTCVENFSLVLSEGKTFVYSFLLNISFSRSQKKTDDKTT
jgi:hypothetical protein